MTARTQQARGRTPNAPPANGSLLPGQLYTEMNDPVRLWVGVPTTINPNGTRLILDATAVAPLASPVFTGNPQAPTQSPGDNDTSLSTTAFTTAAVAVETARATNAENLRAPISNPVLTGDPQAPTPSLGDADTSIATTAFVANTIAAMPPAGALVSDAPPTATPGTLWWDSVGGNMYLRYQDPNTTQWVPTTNLTGLANAATKDDVASSLQNVGRNKLHNSMFNVAQRGAGPFTSLAGAYALDRWLLNGSTDTASIRQFAASDADRATIGDEAASVFLANSFTGNAAAGAYHEIQQRIEDVRRLAGKTLILSFYAVASSALKLGFNYTQRMGTGGSPSTDVNVLITGNSVTLGGTWTRYSTTVTMPGLSGKTLGTNGDHATYIRIAYSSGANTNAFFGNIGVQSGSVNIWGVQLEIAQPGQTQPTPLEKPDPVMQLQQCQRFYQTSWVSMATYQLAANAINIVQQFPVQMRANPTMTIVAGSPVLSNANTPAVGPFGGPGCFSASATAIASAATSFYFNYTASADL